MSKQSLGLPLLTALVIGNMVGSGIFMLPRKLAEVASPAGVMLGWLINGAGVLMLALVFGNLAVRKPDLSGGIQVYARTLFPEGSNISRWAGYMVAWGYWVDNWAGNVAIITTFASYLSTFFPSMASRETLLTVAGYPIGVGNVLTLAVCTALLWGTHWIILQGIRSAGKLKFESSYLIPFAADKINKSGQYAGLPGQINDAAVITLWAFVGVESAVVFSSRARKQSHVKAATVAGMLTAVLIYLGISILTMGTLAQEQLIVSDKPLADALSVVVGDAGLYAMSALALIALIGSTTGWILLSAEVPYQAARQGLFPPSFLKENGKGAPVFSLIVTNACAQFFIFSTISNTLADAYVFIITVATLSYLVPYIVASLNQVKLVLTGDTYAGDKRNRVAERRHCGAWRGVLGLDHSCGHRRLDNISSRRFAAARGNDFLSVR